MTTNVKNRSMLSALGMQLVSKYANVVVQLLITMVLARLLTPKEFGTVAIVTVFSSFFAILADMGVSTAIVQYKDLTKTDYDALFLFSIILGVVLTGLFCLLSLPISNVYDDGELIPLCCLTSLSVLFNTLNMVPNGILLREKRFKTISVRLVVVSVVAGAVAVAMAFLGFGCYALVWNVVLTSLFVLLWNWASTRVALTNPHFISPVRRILRFSGFQAGFSIVNYFARNLDNLLVGALMGSAQLGYYDKAYKVMQYPLNYLTGIFSNVLQPYLSEYQNDKLQLYKSWLAICRVLAVVGMLATALIVSFPEEILLIMYGDQWLVAAPALGTLGLSVGIQMVNSTSGAIFQSAGRTDMLFRSGLICTLISIAGILVGIGIGSLWVLGLAISVAYALHFLVTGYLLVGKVLGESTLSFLLNFVPSIIAAVFATLASNLILLFLGDVPAMVALLARAALLVGVYAVVIVFTGEHQAFRAFSDMKKIGVSE